MGTTRDTRPANWGKRVKKWRRWIEELKAEADVQCIEPPSFDTPPHRRIAEPS